MNSADVVFLSIWFTLICFGVHKIYEVLEKIRDILNDQKD